MVDPALAVFLKVLGNRAFAVERVYQLDLRAINREESSRGFGGGHVFCAIEREAEILQKTLDGFFKVRHGNSDMVEMGNHRRLNERWKGHKGGRHFSGLGRLMHPLAAAIMPPMTESPPESLLLSPPPAAKTPVQLVTVDENHDGQRIDNFLLSQLKGVPRTLIYRILRKGEVRVNKGRAKPEQKLNLGDVVRIPPLHLPEADAPPKAGNNLLADLEARILYEDKQLLVINKPAGLAVHGGSGIRLGLIEALRQMRPQEKMLELVHRLDRDTSGCILIAKKRSTLTALHDDLREGRVDKRYLALVHGRWPARIKDVKVPLLKNELASMVRVSDNGKPSHTGFTIKQLFDGYTLLEAKPYAGRTHQIRVHAKHAGHSLVGDDKYTEREKNDASAKRGFKRLCLHAACLTFTLPASGEKMRCEAPLPDDIAVPMNALCKG